MRFAFANSPNVYLLAFFVLVGLAAMHAYPDQGREICHDSFIALVAVLSHKAGSDADQPPTARA